MLTQPYQDETETAPYVSSPDLSNQLVTTYPEALQPQLTRVNVRGCWQQGQTSTQTASLDLQLTEYVQGKHSTWQQCSCLNCGLTFMCLPRWHLISPKLVTGNVRQGTNLSFSLPSEERWIGFSFHMEPLFINVYVEGAVLWRNCQSSQGEETLQNEFHWRSVIGN